MSRIIKILGTGCPKCQLMTSIVKEVVSEHNIDAAIEKVEDIMEIMKFNVITTPALLIDNVTTIKGRVPDKKEVLALLQFDTTNKTDHSSSDCCSQNKCC